MTRPHPRARWTRRAALLGALLTPLLLAAACAQPPADAAPGSLVATDTVAVALRTDLPAGGSRRVVRATVLTGPLTGVALRGVLPLRPGARAQRVLFGEPARLRAVLEPESGEIRVTATLRTGERDEPELRLHGRSHVDTLHADAVRRYWPGYAGTGLQRYGLPAPSEPMFLPIPMPFHHA